MSIQAQIWAREQSVGNPGAKFVLWILADYAGPDGGSCFPKIETICRYTEQSDKTVRRALDYLEDQGLITRFRYRSENGRLGQYSYRLSMSCPDAQSAGTIGEPAAKMTAGPQVKMTAGPQVRMTALNPPESFLTPIKEKKAASREGFLREVKKGVEDGAFAKEFGHLEETEIMICGEACLDHWEAKGEFPKGDPIACLRGWIRNGIRRKAIRGPEAKIKPVEADKVPEPECIPDWQQPIRARLGGAAWASWIRPLERNGSSIIAPSKFHADYVRNHYGIEISRIIPGAEIIHSQQEASHGKTGQI